MDDKVIKDHKLVIKSVKLNDKPTKNNGKMYNVAMEHTEAGLELSAVTFSDTLAAELEKSLDKQADLKMSEHDYNGAKSYTIVEVNGVKNSGFQKGKGYQQDTVGLERRAAAEYATSVITAELNNANFKPLSSKALQEAWKQHAEFIYVWISTRPPKPSENVMGELTKADLDKIPF